MDEHVALRAFEAGDLGFLDRLSIDPEALGRLQWKGFRGVRDRRRRWEEDGYIGTDSSAVAVVVGDAVAGIASWQRRDRGVAAGVCFEIGVALLPEHRGRGVGTAAHRLLVDHLFDYTTVHRLEASTAAENIAERTVLERVGFVQEGVLRGAAFLRGTWYDVVVYGLLRDDRPAVG
jgi:RimJ/RimL family protein N-acetyltransferase